MSRNLPLALFLAVSLLLPGVALAAPPNQFPAGRSGIGDPYFPLDGNGGYDVQHYDLDVSYDPDTDELTGEATIQAPPPRTCPRSTSTLSGCASLPHGERTRGDDPAQGPGAHRQAEDRDHQRFALHRRGAATTACRRRSRNSAAPGFIHTDDGAIVVGEPHVAATLVPGQRPSPRQGVVHDHDHRAAGLEALSNGVLSASRPAATPRPGPGTRVEPMTTYLATMAIGQFDIDAYTAGGLAYWDAIDHRFSSRPRRRSTGLRRQFSSRRSPSRASTSG